MSSVVHSKSETCMWFLQPWHVGLDCCHSVGVDWDLLGSHLHSSDQAQFPQKMSQWLVGSHDIPLHGRTRASHMDGLVIVCHKLPYGHSCQSLQTTQHLCQLLHTASADAFWQFISFNSCIDRIRFSLACIAANSNITAQRVCSALMAVQVFYIHHDSLHLPML